MNSTCSQDPIGFIKFSILPEFVPQLMDKDLLHKKSFQVNDIRENLSPHIENARLKPQT